MTSRKEWEFEFLDRGISVNQNLITKCCICGNEIETKKILPYRDFMGLGIGTWNVHIAQCDKCGFVFYQNPLSAEQLENRYKHEAYQEYDSNEYVNAGEDDYSARCHRQKHFIDENIATPTRGGVWKYSGSWRGVWLQPQPLWWQKALRHRTFRTELQVG